MIFYASPPFSWSGADFIAINSQSRQVLTVYLSFVALWHLNLKSALNNSTQPGLLEYLTAIERGYSMAIVVGMRNPGLQKQSSYEVSLCANEPT